MRQPGEPSVEQILDSIKQVMARDTRALAARTAVAATDDPDDVLDLAEVAQIRLVPPTRPAEPAVTSAQDDAPLVAANLSDTMRGSLEALASIAAPSVPPSAAATGETSLETMVRELLRPALAAWLDQHLPPIVERMVAAEIARIAGRRG